MVKQAAIFALQPYTAYAFTANGVLTKRRDAPAAVALFDGALVRAAPPLRAISVAGSTHRPSSRREAGLDPPDRLGPRSR